MVHYLFRPRYFEKLIFWIFVVLFFILFTYRGFHVTWPVDEKHPKLSYRLSTKNALYIRQILVWSTDEPLHVFRKKGQDAFLESRCKYSNCFTTYKQKSIEDLSPYDAIVFSVDSFSAYKPNLDLPKTRIPRQRYIFASTKSATFADPITLPKLDDFFNWTWTYRLDSDILWRHFVMNDLKGRQIGPKLDMKWLGSFKPTSKKVKAKLWFKNKAAAWLVYSCQSPQERAMETYVFDLRKELDRYNSTVDVYGPCRKDCGTLKNCAKILKRDYYFYLAFENSFDEDYVSIGLLNAVNNYALPVVMGGANYSRFLPPGSYLDATKINATAMATTMIKIMTNFTLYQDYFRWTNHYKYKNSLEKEVCNLCAALNSPRMMNEVKTHNTFRKWWWTGTEQRRNLYDLINEKYSKKLDETFEINKLVQSSLYMY